MKRSDFLRLVSVGAAAAFVVPKLLVQDNRAYVGVKPIIDKDFMIDVDGSIRYIGDNDNKYTVLELHRWLQDLADDAAMDGPSVLDITSENPSVRYTDQLIRLKGKYYLDENMLEHLTDGTIEEERTGNVYSGIVKIGEFEDGTVFNWKSDLRASKEKYFWKYQ